MCLCQNGTIIRIIGQVKHCPFNLLEVRNNKKVGSFLRWLENFHQIAEVFPTFLKKYIDCIRDYFRGERNSLAWEYYEGYFPFSHRLLANLILKSHKFHIFVINWEYFMEICQLLNVLFSKIFTFRPPKGHKYKKTLLEDYLDKFSLLCQNYYQ